MGNDRTITPLLQFGDVEKGKGDRISPAALLIFNPG